MQRAERLAGALQGPPALLHTDAHAGNFRVAAGQAVLVDLEQIAVGPALYDLAALEVTERRFRGDRELPRLRHGLRRRPGRPAPATADRAPRGARGRVRRELGHLDVAAERLAQLDDPDARWMPF